MSIERRINKENVVCTYNRILFSPKEEGITEICNNMNGPRGHFAKWNKPDTLYEVSKIVKFIKSKTRMVVNRGWFRRGNGELLINRNKVSVR